VLDRALARAARSGVRFDGPLSDTDLCAIDPRLAGVADFPARLEVPGITWVGAYGPVDGLADACDAAIAILSDHGFPPLIVARPMKGGHFAVLRFVEVFEPDRDGERARVVACNGALCDLLRDRGFVMYRTPGWAVDRYRAHLDAGFARLLGEVKHLLDPDGIMNPGRWTIP
jgi:FAD/FMN-containing dehydrogenase